jgi:hypothetical protein
MDLGNHWCWICQRACFFLKGLGNFVGLGSVLNLHFVDDIIVFLEVFFENVQALIIIVRI